MSVIAMLLIFVVSFGIFTLIGFVGLVIFRVFRAMFSLIALNFLARNSDDRYR